MKVYLDNDVVSAIAKDDNAAESAALDLLLAAYRDGKVDLVTSTMTLEEIKAYQGRCDRLSSGSSGSRKGADPSVGRVAGHSPPLEREHLHKRARDSEQSTLRQFAQT
jgi:hypothetical protein